MPCCPWCFSQWGLWRVVCPMCSKWLVKVVWCCKCTWTTALRVSLLKARIVRVMGDSVAFISHCGMWSSWHYYGGCWGYIFVWNALNERNIALLFCLYNQSNIGVIFPNVPCDPSVSFFYSMLLLYVIHATYVCSTHTIAFHCTVAKAINVIDIFICIGTFIAILMISSVTRGIANVYSCDINDPLVPLAPQMLLIFHPRSITILSLFTHTDYILSKLASSLIQG